MLWLRSDICIAVLPGAEGEQLEQGKVPGGNREQLPPSGLARCSL